MSDFYEIDFLDVEAEKSGDAIAIRYETNGTKKVHLVDGGYKLTGEKIIRHINGFYKTNRIDHLIITHSDSDHTGGIVEVIEKMEIGEIWMLRPWNHTDELLSRFTTKTSDGLRRRLRDIYWSLVDIEDAAKKKSIPIKDPFQGCKIGEFTVLSPSKTRYLDLIVESEKTPESIKETEISKLEKAGQFISDGFKKIVSLIAATWNEETFSSDETSAENEMSVVQSAIISGKKIVLTGDVGRNGLTDAADYATNAGISLPGVNLIQVPHHGSRRNVSTELLDRWLGERLPSRPEEGKELFTAICSSAKADKNHPRNSVKRAFIHRGAKFIATESRSIRSNSSGAPARDGWSAVKGDGYPETQES